MFLRLFLAFTSWGKMVAIAPSMSLHSEQKGRETKGLFPLETLLLYRQREVFQQISSDVSLYRMWLCAHR